MFSGRSIEGTESKAQLVFYRLSGLKFSQGNNPNGGCTPSKKRPEILLKHCSDSNSSATLWR
jgi:hypothetical protein